MKFRTLVLATLLIVSILCIYSFFPGCINGKGDLVEKTIQLESFEEVELSSSIPVYIKQGAKQEIRIIGQSNLISNLNTDVKRRTWKAKFDKCVRKRDKFEVHITSPLITSIEINGSGDIYFNSDKEQSDLEFEISGSGNIHANVKVKELESEINGSGDIFLSGVVKKQEINISGSGKVEAFECISEDIEVDISGSGEVRVNSTKSLDVEISGSGDVYYKGNPKNIVQENKGSGKVIQVD